MGDRVTARRVALVLVVALMAVGCSGTAEDTGQRSAASSSAGPAETAADVRSPSDKPSDAPPVTGSAPPTTAARVGADDASGADGGGGDDAPAPASREIVAAAVDDLAGRLTVAPDSIVVLLAEGVTWPDNSIGCPLRDRQYFDDPVEGTRVHLVARGELYRYHTGGDRTQPFLCDISLKSEVPIRRIEP
jgi:hypothetical protein